MSPIAGIYGSPSARGYGQFMKPFSENFFIIAPSTTELRWITSDTQGRIFVSIINRPQGSYNYNEGLFAFNKRGELLWGRIGGAAYLTAGRDGYLYGVEGGVYQVKIDPSNGSYVWRLQFVAAQLPNPEFGAQTSDIEVDSGGNVYMATGDRVIRFDSEGTLVWAKALYATKIRKIGSRLYAIGSWYEYDNSGDTTYFVTLSRLNTATGNLVWSKKILLGGIQITQDSLTSDNNGNIYLTFVEEATSRWHTLRITDTGSSASIVWSKRSSADRAAKVMLDAEDNPWLSLLNDDVATWLIPLYAPNGNVIEPKRRIRETTTYPSGIVFTSRPIRGHFDMYNASSKLVLTYGDKFITLLPQDGSKTGTYEFTNTVNDISVTWEDAPNFDLVNSNPTMENYLTGLSNGNVNYYKVSTPAYSGFYLPFSVKRF